MSALAHGSITYRYSTTHETLPPELSANDILYRYYAPQPFILLCRIILRLCDAFVTNCSGKVSSTPLMEFDSNNGVSGARIEIESGYKIMVTDDDHAAGAVRIWWKWRLMVDCQDDPQSRLHHHLNCDVQQQHPLLLFVREVSSDGPLPPHSIPPICLLSRPSDILFLPRRPTTYYDRDFFGVTSVLVGGAMTTRLLVAPMLRYSSKMLVKKKKP
ncbi:hypothetical protein EVAR_88795_1 [Eumeta japonica]|uniref:Uncharacterized protein n=1 Tax=Eumeta variegata TaxID=151549 RepID=A0A4C1YJG0_EUMVA|nr:hypothetical protein EVAR_88795_1 [Eumeta japonica]